VLAPLLFCALAAVPQAASAKSPEPAQRPPNVVLILADDVGYGDLGCYAAESKIPTPSLDRLASEGLRFTDAHTPSAVCTPTRYGLLTGRYAWRGRLERGVLWGRSRLLIEAGRATLPQMLRDKGYRTACIGKWHLGLGAWDPRQPDRPTDFDKIDAGPHTVGFERSFVFPGSLDMEPYLFVVDGKKASALTEITQGSDHRWVGGDGFWRPGESAAGFSHEQVLPRLLNETLAYLDERAKEPAVPFFLFFSLTAPHTPWLPTAEYRGKSRAGWYGDFVAQVDGTVGELMQRLEERGLAEDTLVLFASDNGAHWRDVDIETWTHRANGPWRGQKADIHEAGHRVPFIARWPGHVPAGGTSAALVSLHDLYATLAELLGHELGKREAEDSQSFLAVLEGRAESARQELVLHSFDGMFALRSGDWKLIEGRGSGGFTDPVRHPVLPGEPPGQLYHLGRDPGERTNLWSQEPEVVERLLLRLKELRRR